MVVVVLVEDMVPVVEEEQGSRVIISSQEEVTMVVEGMHSSSNHHRNNNMDSSKHGPNQRKLMGNMEHLRLLLYQEEEWKVRYFILPKCTWVASLDKRESLLMTCRNVLGVISKLTKMYPWGKIVRFILRESGKGLRMQSRC